MESLHPCQDGINARMYSRFTLIITIFQRNKWVAFKLSLNFHGLRNFTYWNPSYVDIDATPPFVIKWWRHTSTLLLPYIFSALTYLASHSRTCNKYEGWNFNFGNTPLDWIQELLEWRANAAGRMGPSSAHIHNGSGPSRNGHTQ